MTYTIATSTAAIDIATHRAAIDIAYAANVRADDAERLAPGTIVARRARRAANAANDATDDALDAANAALDAADHYYPNGC